MNIGITMNNPCKQLSISYPKNVYIHFVFALVCVAEIPVDLG